MGIFDVPPSYLILEMAKGLQGKIEKPEWIGFVKTGPSRERAPSQADFWFIRNASILYRVYKDGPVGSGTLRTYYGGRKNRGVKPEHHAKASGKIIRTCLNALEKNGFIKKSKKGRVITPAGQKYMHAISKIVEKNIKENVYAAKEKKKAAETDRQSKEVVQALKKQEKREKPQLEEKKKAEKK